MFLFFKQKRIILELNKNLNKAIAIVLLALLLPVTCASDKQKIQFFKNTEVNQTKKKSSIAGNYLAGRHAQASNDISNATLYFSRALEASPDSQSLLQRTFLMMTSEGRIDESLPLAHKILIQNSRAPVANLTVIAGDIHLNQFSKAMKKIKALPVGGLNDYVAPLLAAWISVAQGRSVQNSLAQLKPLKQEGSKPIYYFHKALILDFRGDQEQAVKAYLEGIKEQGTLALRAAQLLGNLYERKGEITKAKALYKQFARDNPSSYFQHQALRLLNNRVNLKPIITTAKQGAAESFLGIATSLFQQNAREMALFYARLGLYLRPDFPVMKVLLGNLLQTDGQLENANSILLSIDSSSIYSWPARLNVAENLNDLDRTDEAIKTLRLMAKEEPKLAGSLIKLGDILRVRKRFSEAQVAYHKAINRIGELKSHHWVLLYARGIVFERTKQWDKAEDDFLRALEFSPDQPSVLNYLGYSWVDKGIHLDRAKKLIQKAVKLRPNDGYIVDSLGWAYFQLGEFSNSVKEMERAVELKPEDPVLNDHLGDALWRVGRKVEARYQWNRALIFKPDDNLRIQIVKKLANGLPDLPKKIN